MKRQFIVALIFVSMTLLCGVSAIAQPSSLDTLRKSGFRLTPLSNGCDTNLCTFYVSGAITGQTVKEAKSFLDANKNKSLIVDLDSLGGDVSAALELGRTIRKYGATTRLMSGVCASACVMAFVGGVNRTALSVSPKFGIHTPYTTDTNSTTYENSDTRFKTISRLVTQYLQDMNIPSGLYEEMLRYPAESMHTMTREELLRYRVLGMDTAEQDRSDSSSARYYGLDKRTYLSRKQLAKLECDKYFVERPTQDSILQQITCHERIMNTK
jgi:hypothetical protein